MEKSFVKRETLIVSNVLDELFTDNSKEILSKIFSSKLFSLFELSSAAFLFAKFNFKSELKRNLIILFTQETLH